MKISYNWLKDYARIEKNVEEIAKILTFCGLEVENIEKYESIKGGLAGFVIGKVLSCENHPDSDHLHLTKVDIGTAVLDIVCGAGNVATGQKVVVATLGTKIYDENGDSFEIKKAKLRGYPSEGMICSEKELLLSDNHDGIMVLPDDVALGTLAKDYFKIEQDWVWEIGLTPNRSDAASHIGVARDLTAVYNLNNNEQKLSLPDVSDFKEGTKLTLDFEIDNEICPRYSGVLIDSIEIQPSPQWLQNRLKAVGIRPVNNVVDVTNYVMLETGQPLHAFDYEKISGRKINVKKLPKDTEFITLDGIKRILNGNEIMICSNTEPMCMGGVFGGKDSGINNETKAVFLESAFFNPVLIRKASKYHNLHTDSAFRFERTTDINNTVFALKRAAILIKELANGEIASQVYDIYPNKVENSQIEINLNRVFTLIGKKIERETVKKILRSLGIDIIKEENEILILSVPTNKVDVTRESDIVEEILRIYGYDNVEIPAQLRSSLSFKKGIDREKIQNIVSDLLADNGFYEIMNNSLTKESYYLQNKDFKYENSVQILNPLSKDLALMRQTLLYGCLETVVYNLNRKYNNIKIFEFGNCYSKDTQELYDSDVTKRYRETKHLSLAISGNIKDKNWRFEEEKTNFFHLKSYIETVFERLRIDKFKLVMENSSNTYFSEGLQYMQGNKEIVIFGRIDNKILKQFDIKQDVFYADFNWTNILKILDKKEIQYQEISKFPEVKRDLALVIDKNITFNQITEVCYSVDKKILQRNIDLFDVYEGEKLEKDKKQYAVSLTFLDREKTLTQNQIDKLTDNIIKALEDKLGAKLR